MSEALILSTVGIKARPNLRLIDGHRGKPEVPAPDRRTQSSTPPRRRRVLAPTPVIDEASEPAAQQREVTVRLEADVAARLHALARAAGVAADDLAAIALERGLPAGKRQPPERPASSRASRREVRLPGALMERMAQLSRADATSPRAHSPAINAAIRRGLPASPRRALALVVVAAG